MADVSLVTAYDGQGQILLGKRRDSGKWTLPGGHVDEGETPEACATREFREETGLKLESLSPLTTYMLEDGTVLHCFSAFATGEPHGKDDPDQECEEWKYFPIDDIPTNLHGPKDLQNLILRLFGMQKDEIKKYQPTTFDHSDPSLGKAEDEVSTLLDHPDHNERLMALKLHSATPKHVTAAALDPDPIVHQAAIEHPRFDQHAGLALLEAQKAKNGTYPLAQKLAFLAKPEGVHAFHLAAAIHAAREAPADVVDRFHEALVAHPSLTPDHVRELYTDPGVSHQNRVKVVGHSATPEDVLETAAQTGLMVPSLEAQEIAKTAVQHPRAPQALLEGTVRAGINSRLGHVQQIAEHALASNTIPPKLIDELLVRARVSPTEQNLRLAGAALRGSAATEQNVDELLRMKDPVAWKHAMGARGLQPRHLDRINAFLNASPMAKATDPEDFRAMGFHPLLAPDGPRTVDHTFHLGAHPPSMGAEVEAYKTHVLSHPDVIRNLARFPGEKGATPKVAYRIKSPARGTSGVYAVKPYHEKVLSGFHAFQKFPIQGWAEMANQALYHAAGIGRLHQRVHVAEHDMGEENGAEPGLVIHFARGFKSVTKADSLQHGQSRKPLPDEETSNPHGDVRKIAIMDFLSNNMDHHSENLMVDKKDRILTIDHGRSFQYISPRHPDIKWLLPNRKPSDLQDEFWDYHRASALDELSPFLHPHVDGESDRRKHTLEHYKPAFRWWGGASPKVRAEFENQLKAIKDERLAKHLRRNFNERANWLDERAGKGLDHFGEFWYFEPVKVYRIGQVTPEEEAAMNQRERELADQEERTRREGLGGLSKALYKVVEYVKMAR